jgi:hypothetical protein
MMVAAKTVRRLVCPARRDPDINPTRFPLIAD